LDEKGIPTGSIPLPEDARAGFESDEPFTYTIKDKDGNVYEMSKDEDGYVSSLTVNEFQQDGNNQFTDTVMAKKKVDDLIIILRQRIKEYLNNSPEKYLKLAFDNENVLSLIVEFDPNIGSGGQYRNGKLYVGTKNFVENSIDEDILATIFHEYLHYLNWQYGDKYRMDNLENGYVYKKTVECFEKKMQTEAEFLDDAYSLFFLFKINTPNAHAYLSYPSSYNELDDAQKKEVETYIEENKLKREIKCFAYDYSPSNFYKDEINAHTETINAHNKAVFKMTDDKVIFYHGEINRYTNLYNKSKTYEINNNINSDGYEK
jgi:hypothetical protein